MKISKEELKTFIKQESKELIELAVLKARVQIATELQKLGSVITIH